MVPPDMLEEKVCDSSGVNHSNGGYSMDVFRQPVYYHKDGIVSFGLWQFPNGVNGNNLPVVAWDPVWGKLPVTLISPGYEKGPLGPADIRSATRLPPQPPGPPGVSLVQQG